MPLEPGWLLTTRRWGRGVSEGEGDDTKPKEQERKIQISWAPSSDQGQLPQEAKVSGSIVCAGGDGAGL